MRNNLIAGKDRSERQCNINTIKMGQITNTTKPGLNKETNLLFLSKEELTIVEYFARKYWYVTRIDRISIASSSYNIAFIKPTQEISIGFNLYREVVLVFSPYDKFEPRSLDAIDSLDVQELRLEEICSVVISKDNDVSKKIATYLKSNQESRVIIPFTYTELLAADNDEFVPNRFRQLFYQRDLFDIQDPLQTDLYFFGRTDLVHEIVNKHLCKQNLGLFGLRKTGKTSILFGVERVLKKKGAVSVFIDCQTLHLQEWQMALFLVISEIRKHCGVSKNKIHTQEDYNSSLTSEHFKEDIQCIFRENDKHSILLIFDEIENVTFGTSVSPSWKSGESFIKFWQVIRSTYQILHKENVFTYLIAGTNPHCVEQARIDKVDNPLFAQFNPTFIAPFTYDQTKEMVQRLGGYMGLDFPDTICGHLVEDFGGHPLLIRQMCSFIHRSINESRPFRIDKSLYNKVKDEFYRSSTGFNKYAEMVLDVLISDYPDEYDMLTFLAVGDVESFNGFAQQDSAYTLHLLNYGIIGENAKRDGFTFKIEAIGDYLRQKTRYQRIHLSLEEKWAEINERRNKIEPKLRNLVRRQLKSGLGLELATEKIKSALTGDESSNKEKIKRLSKPTYSDFFDPNKVNIYLRTLFKVIVANYETCFRNLIGEDVEIFNAKAKIIMSYGRPDAHAKAIDDNSFGLFRGAMSWLEKIIEENQ